MLCFADSSGGGGYAGSRRLMCVAAGVITPARRHRPPPGGTPDLRAPDPEIGAMSRQPDREVPVGPRAIVYPQQPCCRRRLQAAAFPLGDAQPTVAQPFDELPDAHWFGARSHQLVVPVLRHVVVIDVETPPGDAHSAGKIVQLIERAVTHQVRPEHLVGWPSRLIDQDGH